MDYLFDTRVWLAVSVVVAGTVVAVTYLALQTTKKKITIPRYLAQTSSSSQQRDTETLPFQSVLDFDVSRFENTVYNTFRESAEKYKDRKCLGSRPLVEIIKEEKTINGVKKQWQFLHLGEYQWLTYQETLDQVHHLGSGLRCLGLEQKDFLGIYEETRKEWTMMEQAAFSQSLIITTVYANLGEDAVAFSCQETEMKAIMTNGSLLKIIVKALESCSSLKFVIYTDEVDAEAKSALENKGLKVISFNELVEMGKDTPREPSPPRPEDIAVVMYTSGSTGNPKGVVITHRNLVSALQVTLSGSDYKVQDDDVYISFLPLAHVLALVAENSMLWSGVSIGYGNPRSLVDSAVKKCKGDLRELCPTLMAGVPTVFDRVKKGAREKIEKSGGITKSLFNFAYQKKKLALSNNEDTPFWNSLVFNKFKDQLGGRMRIMLSGGAPLSRDTHEFLRVCFSCAVLQGYGLTETCGGGTLMHIQDNSYSRVGAPLPGLEIKLVDVPEMGYLNKDFPNPRGEIFIRGPNVATGGYYKNKEKTVEVFNDEGWFCTGDVGMFHPDGSLEIIDRVKNLVKLSHGEYIALESLESKFKNSSLVENICVVGRSEEAFPVALVCPSRPRLLELAKEKGLPNSEDFDALCQDKQACKEILNSVISVGRTARLKTFELPKAIFLCSEEWTPESGMMTAAMKLKRIPLIKTYKEEIDRMYKENQ